MAGVRTYIGSDVISYVGQGKLGHMCVQDVILFKIVLAIRFLSRSLSLLGK